MKRISLISALLFTAIISLTAQNDPRIIIETGHNKPVTALTYDENRDILFSCSEDGTLRIWNPDNGSLFYNENVSKNPITLTALHPSRPEAAVVTSDNLNSFVLLVYDWEKGMPLYTVKLPELPLFLEYSPEGDFLVYGITDWKSLTFINSETGVLLPWLTDGFGIVSSAFISSSGKTILTYSPSGYIQYWGVEDGTLKKRVPTIPNLEKAVFTDNGRYMAAVDGTEIVLIDLLSGTPVSRNSSDEIEYISFTPDFKRLYAYCKTNRGYYLSIYEYTSNRLLFVKKLSSLEIRDIRGMAVENSRVFLTDTEGSIFKFDSESEDLSLFSGSRLYGISDVDMNDQGLLLASENDLLMVNPLAFTDFSALKSSESLMTLYDLPFEGIPGVVKLDDEQFIVYSSDAASGTLALFSPEDGYTKIYDTFPYAFSEINYQDGRVLSLDKNGECSVLNLQTDETEFNFTSFGLRTVCFTADGNILGGRSLSSGVITPLLHINTETGETVGIEDNNRLTSRLSFDPATGNIYSIGIEERRNRLRTVLRKHSTYDFSRSETMLTTLGENLEASMLIEPGGTRIFTSLADGGVNMLYWGGFTSFEETGLTPLKLLLMDDFLIGLNSEGSLTFWNKATGEELFTFYLFDDLEWAALFPGNKFISSSGGEKYIGIYSGTSRRKLSAYKYRKKL